MEAVVYIVSGWCLGWIARELLNEREELVTHHGRVNKGGRREGS